MKNRKCAFLFFTGILIFTILITGLAVRLGQAGIAAVGTVDDVETRLYGDITTIGTVEDMGHAAAYPEPQSGTRATASTASHPAPAITSISPASNQVGKEVTINGTGFGVSRDTSHVSIGGVQATDYTSWSDTQVVCRVPQGTAGLMNIAVVTANGQSYPGPFKVIPAISATSPPSGRIGDVVTINGTGFGSTREKSCVKFGGAKSPEYISWSDTQILCEVPAGAARTVKLTVTTAGGISGASSFKVDPYIASTSATSGKAGKVVTINGTGFGTQRGKSFISFGSVKARAYVSWSKTQIKVKVPSGASGAIALTMTTGGGISNSHTFEVRPCIVMLSSTSSTAGEVVTVKGTGFGVQRGSSFVTFGGVKATTYASWSNTAIKVKVPARAAGAMRVRVTTAGGTSNRPAFKAKPHIARLSAAYRAPGKMVTITGTGFGTRRGSSYVTFGDVKATTYLSWSNTAIKVKVPTAADEARQVKVTTAGGISGGVRFGLR